MILPVINITSQEYNGIFQSPKATSPTSTITESTANRSGRIDHYLVYHGQLYLFKVQVTMPEAYKDHIPRRGRRETIIRTERMTRIDSIGTREVFLDSKIVNLIFDDLIVHFDGNLVMGYPTYDPWEHPASVDEEDSLFSKRSTLSFRSGKLVDSLIEDI